MNDANERRTGPQGSQQSTGNADQERDAEGRFTSEEENQGNSGRPGATDRGGVQAKGSNEGGSARSQDERSGDSNRSAGGRSGGR